mmetsp:Transcript_62868/g.146371  ORF Transcript_62868/g.146371 Transcript_62868/m.146371 type:complete len:307 (+) Transcript_62868:194-1114(+)
MSHALLHVEVLTPLVQRHVLTLEASLVHLLQCKEGVDFQCAVDPSAIDPAVVVEKRAWTLGRQGTWLDLLAEARRIEHSVGVALHDPVVPPEQVALHEALPRDQEGPRVLVGGRGVTRGRVALDIRREWVRPGLHDRGLVPWVLAQLDGVRTPRDDREVVAGKNAKLRFELRNQQVLFAAGLLDVAPAVEGRPGLASTCVFVPPLLSRAGLALLLALDLDKAHHVGLQRGGRCSACANPSSQQARTANKADRHEHLLTEASAPAVARGCQGQRPRHRRTRRLGVGWLREQLRGLDSGLLLHAQKYD